MWRCRCPAAPAPASRTAPTSGKPKQGCRQAFIQTATAHRETRDVSRHSEQTAEEQTGSRKQVQAKLLTPPLSSHRPLCCPHSPPSTPRRCSTYGPEAAVAGHTRRLKEAILLGYQHRQVKIAELPIDSFRMMLALEWHDSRLASDAMEMSDSTSHGERWNPGVGR